MFVQDVNFGNELKFRCGHIDGAHNSDLHLHQNIEMNIILDGEIEITVDGKTYTATRGDIAIIPPFSIHSFCTRRYVKMLIMVFSVSLVTDFLPFNTIRQKRLSHIHRCSDHLLDFVVNSGFYDITHTKMSFDPVVDFNYLNKLKSTIYLILSEYYESVPVVSESRVDNTLSKILIYICENYTRNLSLKTVGTALGYTPKYVSECIKSIPGLGFRSFLNSLRIEYAKKLLTSTDKSNVEISYDCGFISQASFHRAFFEFTGNTPKQFRSNKKKTDLIRT